VESGVIINPGAKFVRKTDLVNINILNYKMTCETTKLLPPKLLPTQGTTASHSREQVKLGNNLRCEVTIKFKGP